MNAIPLLFGGSTRGRQSCRFLLEIVRHGRGSLGNEEMRRGDLMAIHEVGEPRHADHAMEMPLPGARRALALLLLINLFNYIDRYVLAAVLPLIAVDAAMLDPGDPYLQTKLGLLGTAFMAAYLACSPVFAWLAGWVNRWTLVGGGVLLWSLASGSSGLAPGYALLFLTRCLVGVGEAAYGPVAPSMLSDLYPIRVRGKVMAFFYMAIPVGSALGFVIGGIVANQYGWRASFLVTYSGLILGLLCFAMREPPRPPLDPTDRADYFQVLKSLLRNRSFVCCCLGMTATTFILGGVAVWVPAYFFQRESRFLLDEAALSALREPGPDQAEVTASAAALPSSIVDKLAGLTGATPLSYLEFRAGLTERLSSAELERYGARIYDRAMTADSPGNQTVTSIFGGIVVISGFFATLLGGLFGDWLRNRGVRGAYFHAAGWSTLAAWPFFIGMLYAPLPLGWILLFLAVFLLFFNTGPANTVLANVTRSRIRATAFAINILIIHLLGDAISPPIIGFIADLSDLHTGFIVASIFILVGGGFWVAGARFLDEDTRRAEQADQPRI
jgi:MFS family permease